MDYNKEGKPRRQRISAGDRKVYSGGGNNSRRSFSDRKQYGEQKPSGDRKPYGERKQYGEHKQFNGERKQYGEHKQFNGERKQYGERKSFGGERKQYGEHKSFNGERKQYGERKSFNGERRQYGNKPYGKKPFTRKEENSEGINRMIEQRNEMFKAELSDNDNTEVPVKEVVRLNKFIANSGICSRREADDYILAGVVTVNGEVVTELGSKVNIYNDDVRFNGERLHGENKVYIVMNKPKGYVTTASDPHADKTVMDLLKGCNARVFAVGRLDKNTTGVLMFTNDGEMAEKLTHPSYDKKKIYQVGLDSDLRKDDFDKILAGVSLSDGEVVADDLQYVDENDHRKLGIEIHSGKNRIVRRIFESFGYTVRELDRVYFAGLTKKGLKRGEWRYLTDGEINILKIGSYK